MKSSIDDRFELFLDLYPEAYREFCRRVDQLMGRKITHYSAKAIVELLRFHSIVDGRDTEPWKLNNDYSSRFARKWQEEHPDKADFFETRVLKSSNNSKAA